MPRDCHISPNPCLLYLAALLRAQGYIPNPNLLSPVERELGLAGISPSHLVRQL
mgnify:CR=1 FL=1